MTVLYKLVMLNKLVVLSKLVMLIIFSHVYVSN